MSLQRDPRSFQNQWQNPLIGACVGIFIGLPIAAFIGGQLGQTYHERLAIYLILLLWVIVGAVVLYWRTHRAKARAISIKFIVLWAVMLWLWPLIFLTKPRSSQN